MTNREQCLLNLGEAVKKLGWAITGVVGGHCEEASEDIASAQAAMDSAVEFLHGLSTGGDWPKH